MYPITEPVPAEIALAGVEDCLACTKPNRKHCRISQYRKYPTCLTPSRSHLEGYPPHPPGRQRRNRDCATTWRLLVPQPLRSPVLLQLSVECRLANPQHLRRPQLIALQLPNRP